MDAFNEFTTIPIYKEGTTQRDKRFAPRVKTPQELQDSWQTILYYRRMVQEHDDVPIENSEDRKWLCNKWRADFRKYELSREQQRNTDSQQNSAFNSFLKNKFGGKRFIFAVWEMGITWSPTDKMFEEDLRGATEHVCRRLLKWSFDLSEAIAKHKDDEDTLEATRRSGGNTGQSGLTAEEKRHRDHKK